jgi:branched-chain amino acid transport system substrate-binding protein
MQFSFNPKACTSFKKYFLFGLIALLATSCTKKTDEILVGHYGSMTGPTATFGISTDNGIKLAIDEVNAKGGIKGKKIKLITLDTEGKSQVAAAVVTRLINQNNVVAVLGEVASSNTKSAAPIAQENKVPMITPSSTNTEITKIGDYIFRVCFIDPFQGLVMAKFATENLKAKKAAILRDVKSDYSVELANVFIQEFKKMGGEISLDQSYQEGDIDFKAQLTQIKSKNVDVIFIPGYYTDVGLIAQQARGLGINAKLLGGDGWDSPKLHEIGKEHINGAYFSNHYTTETTEAPVLDFISKYKERYKETPDGLAALGYDAARVLIEAIERTNEITPKNIRDEIAKTKDFNGATGKITLDENRNAIKSAVVVEVQGEARKFVTRVYP